MDFSTDKKKRATKKEKEIKQFYEKQWKVILKVTDVCRSINFLERFVFTLSKYIYISLLYDFIQTNVS